MEKNQIISILANYKTNSKYKRVIKEIGLFGSYSKDSHSKNSDVDIFLKLEPARMFDLIEIKNNIEELLNKKVDIVLLKNSMNPYLKKQIKNYGIYV